jgi:hypothetical protein
MSTELVALQEKYVKQINSLAELKNQGGISQSEFDELVEDILNSDGVLKKLDQQNLAIDVAKFIEGVKLAASLI